MNYMEAIGKGFPLVQCSCTGNGDVYKDIEWVAGAPLPSKSALDSWIAANETVVTRKITPLAFRNRFTQNEKIAMELASLDNPSATMQQRQLAASLRVSMKDAETATFIDLDRADTRAGVQAMETYGIIGAGRATVILDSPVQAIEIPIGHEFN